MILNYEVGIYKKLKLSQVVKGIKFTDFHVLGKMQMGISIMWYSIHCSHGIQNINYTCQRGLLMACSIGCNYV